MAAAAQRRQQRLPPEVNRIIYVRNLPFNISTEELYDLFGRYGGIRQIRIGTSKESRGTAYVVFNDIYDSKQACDHLSGFNVQNRYLIVTYHNPTRHNKKLSLKEQEEQLKNMQDRFGVDGEQHARQAAGGGQKHS